MRAFAKGILRTVDGMADIDEVAQAIERVLGEAGGRAAEPAFGAAPRA
jgi:hypothetical protein